MTKVNMTLRNRPFNKCVITYLFWFSFYYISLNSIKFIYSESLPLYLIHYF